MALRFLRDGYFVGTVGIGTDNPLAKLHVDSSTAFSLTSVSGDTLFLSDDTNPSVLNNIGASIGFSGPQAVQRQAAIAALRTGSDHDHIGLAFYTHPGTSNDETIVEQMRLTDSGKVGIGNDDPYLKLHVTGDTRVQGNLMVGDASRANTPAAVIHIKSSGTNAKLRIEDSDNANQYWDFLVDQGNALYFNEDTDTRVTFKEGGNVGIGTASPSRNLHVHADSGNAYLQLTQAATGTTSNDGFQISMGAAQVNFINRENGNMVFETNNTEKMRITNTGNVGIGIINPAEKLDVDGTLGVSNLPANLTSTSALVTNETIGPEVLSNPDFDTATIWGGSASIANGQLTKTGGGLAYQTYSGLISGGKYLVEVDVASIAGVANFYLGGTNSSGLVVGKQSFYQLGGSSNLLVGFNNGYSGTTGTVFNSVSLKLVTSASNQIQTRQLGTGAFGPTPVGAYLPLTAGSSFPLTGHLFIDTPAGASQSGYALKLNKTNSSSQVQVGGEIFATPWANNTNGGNIIFKNADSATNLQETLRISANGSVGINSTSSSYKLDVGGNARFQDSVYIDTSTGVGGLYVTRQGNTNESVKIYTSDSTSIFETIQDENTGEYGSMSFILDNGAPDPAYTFKYGSLTRLKIEGGTGDVGIGTDSPDGLLHIKKDNALATFEIQGGLNSQTTAGAVNGEINFGVNDSSTTGGIGASIKNISEIANGAHNGLAFYTGLQSRTPYLKQMLYFTARGGLSFGDTNNATGNSGQVLISSGDAPPTWGDAPTGSGTLNTVPLWTPDGNTLGNSPITVSGNDSTFGGSITAPDFRGTAQVYLTSPDSWLFRSTGGSERMRLSSAGNLGINTTNPVYKLDVNGDARSTHFRNGTKGTGTTSTTAGWYKVASWTGGAKRGGSEIKLSTTGGSFTPITWIIRCFKNWSYDATLKLEHYGYANVWFTKARIVRDTTTDILYVEIYQPGTTAVSFEMYQTSLMGYDSNVTMVTGTLAAGTPTADASVRAELPFTTGGTSVEALTIGDSGNTGPYLPLGGGTMTGTNGVLMPDNFKLKFGDATTPDLEIYHDGTNSRIVDNGTGELRLQGTNLRLWASNGETYLTAVEGGAVSLYYDAVKKFETTLTGVTVLGSAGISIEGTNTTNNESILLQGFASTDTLGSIRTANTGGYNQQMRFYTSDITGQPENLTLTLHPTTNASFEGNVDLGDSSNITMAVGAPGQLQVKGSGYTGAVALDATAMYIYHDSALRDLVLGTNETARLTISGNSGNTAITGVVTAPTFSGDLNGTINTVTTAVTKPNTTDDNTVATTAFVKNLIAELPAGLIYKGTWDADTNTPTLAAGGGERSEGTSTTVTANKLIDSTATFTTAPAVVVGDRVRVVAPTGPEFALVTSVDSATQLTLDSDVVTAIGEAYIIEKTPFLTEGNYYIVSVNGATDLNGITDWKVGDWVVASSTNEWQKIDNSSILDGSGTGLTVPLWAGTGDSNTLTNSVISQPNTTTVQLNNADLKIVNDLQTGGNGKARIRFCEDPTGNSMDIYYDGDGQTGPANYTSIFSYSSGIGDVLTATYGGKVGIGTNSPESLLHVKAAAGVTGVIKIEGGNSSSTAPNEINSQLDFGSNDGSVNNTGNVGGRISSVTENTNGALVGMAFSTFQQSRTIDLQEAMRITNAGNVGINTILPGAKLEIQTLRESAIRLSSSDITAGADELLSAIDFYSNDSGNEGVKASIQVKYGDVAANSYMTLNTGGNTEQMRITQLGKVGIGTEDPNQLLSVKGIISSDANDDYYGAWLSGNSDGTADNYIGLGAWYSTAGYLRYIHNNRLQLYTYDDDEYVTLQEAGGFVGIGTAAPRGLLELGTGGSLGAVTNKKISVIIDGGYSTTNALQYNVTSFIGTTLTETSTDIFDQTGSETSKNFYTGLIAPNSYFNNSRYGIVQGGTEVLTIRQGGFTGINEQSSISRLEVGGSFNIDGQRFVFNSDDVLVTGAGTTNQQPIKWNEETHYIPSLAYAFKVKLTVTGTGTDTGANYIVFYDNTATAWVARAVNLAGAGSNHALLNVDSDATGTSMYAYHNHSGGYNIRYWVETFDTGDQDVDGHFFGSDFQWQRKTTDLFYNDGDVGIGTNDPDAKLHIQRAGNGTNNTLILEDNARKLILGRDSIQVTDLVGASSMMYLNQNGNGVTFGGSVYMPDYLYHSGDTNTFIGFPGNDQIALKTSGNHNLFGDATATTIYGGGTAQLKTHGAASGGNFPTNSTLVRHNLLVGTEGGSFIGGTVNYATSQGWVEDAAPNTGEDGYYGGSFSSIGGSAANSIAWDVDPFGSRSLVWTTINDAGSDADGGWNKTITDLPGSGKPYMSVIYVRRNGVETTNLGEFYHGCDGNHTLNLNDSANTNPYFIGLAVSNLPIDVWCVSIGFLQAYDDTQNGTNMPTIRGVYRLDTGAKITDTAVLKMKQNSTQQSQRVYHFYSTNTAANLSFSHPGFYTVDGNEPTLGSILGNSSGLYLPLAGGTMSGNLAIEAASSPKITLQDTTNDVKLLMYAQDSNAVVGTYSTHDLGFYTDSTLALTLNTSQNATFEGDVTVGALTSGETAQLVINHEGGSGAVAKFMSRTNRAFIQVGDNDTNGYLVAEGNEFAIGRAATVSGNSIIIDASHNATFAGNVNLPTANYLRFISAASGSDARILYGNTTGTNGSIAFTRNSDSSTMFKVTGSGNAEITGKGTSSATITSDGSSTLTTKGYVDSLITGATIYRGAWQAGISATSSGTTTASTTLTVAAAILDADGNTPVLVGAVVTGAGITGTVKVASVTSSTVYELDTAIDATATAYIFSPIYGAPDLSGVAETSGYYYICSEAGSATPNGASTEPNTWSVGDWVIYNDVSGTGQWQKIDNSSVLSGVGTGSTVPLWVGPSSVADSDTLGNSMITQSSTAANAQITLSSTSDAQLRLFSTNSWSGIYFDDVGSVPDHIWHNADNGTFALGGGGSNVAGKKLHVDGGMSIGSSYDSVAPAANSGLAVQGNTTIGTGTSHSAARLTVQSGSNSGYMIDVVQEDAYNSGNQAGILFTGKYNAGGSLANLAQITGGKENVTDGDYGGKLIFNTRVNSGAMEAAVQISSNKELKALGNIEADKNVYQDIGARGGYIMRPWGADYLNSTTNVHTGAIKIILPTTGTMDDMLKFTVDIYQYQLNESTSIDIAGYIYQSPGNNTWLNCTTIVNTKESSENYTVRYGDDGTNHCIWIGELTSTWNHPQIIVRNFFGGFLTDTDQYLGEWEIDFEATAFEDVNTTQSNNFPLSSGGVDGEFLPLTAGSTKSLSGDLYLDDGVGINFHSGDVTLTESGTGDFTIDAADDIRLDAGGGDVVLKTGGTEFGRISSLSNSLRLSASGTNEDVFIMPNGTGGVGINNTSPKAKFDVNNRFCVDSKNFSVNNSFATCLTVSLSSHTGCHVVITCFGDWGNHSSAAYRGEFFLQNGGNSYNEPGVILRQDDNTSVNADHIECQLVDPTGSGNPKDFQIQIRHTAASGSFTGYLTYTVQGVFNSIT